MVEAGGWIGGKSYTGAFQQSNIKYHGAGGSSYAASDGTTLTSSSGGTAKVISSSQTIAGGAGYPSTGNHRKGDNGSAVIEWVGF